MPPDEVWTIPALDRVEDMMATVERVVAEGAAGAWPMAAKLENDPAPQRHAQLQEPSESRVPVP